MDEATIGQRMERGITGNLNPHFEYFGEANGQDTKPFPPGEAEEFVKDTADIYSTETIERIKVAGINPVLIGYDHGGPDKLHRIIEIINQVKEKNPDKKLKVLQEVFPQQVGWIRDFLQLEREFKEHGTIHGTAARPDEATRMQAYREKLTRNKYGEALTLWYLENDIEVLSIESTDVKDWIREDEVKLHVGDEANEWLAHSPVTREFFTAVRRDAYGLEQIEREKPDIVATGFLHSAKYDVLLGRDGTQSHYLLNHSFDGPELLQRWKEAHQLYHDVNSPKSAA